VVAVDRSAFYQLGKKKGTVLLTRLAQELNRVGKRVTADSLSKRINNQKFSRYAPVPVAAGVPDQLKIYLEEHATEFPSVVVQRATVRQYPYGPLAANVVGYTAKIGENELKLAQKVSGPSRTTSTTTSGRPASRRPTRPTCGAPPAAARSRSTPTATRSGSSARPCPSRAATST